VDRQKRLARRIIKSANAPQTHRAGECALVRRRPSFRPTTPLPARYHRANEGLGGRVRRPWILAAGIAAGSIALYSCSMQASVTTDDEGRVVEVSALRIESSLTRWAVEMLIVGGQLAIELRPARPASWQLRTHLECPAGDGVPGAAVASA
jgi:hypothetical protein